MKKMMKLTWAVLAGMMALSACSKEVDEDIKEPGTEKPGGGTFEYSTSFDDAVDNEAYQSDGWSSVAMKGDRLWEGKEFEGNYYLANSAHNGQESDYISELTSPIFDMEEAKQKKFSFKTAQAYWKESSSLKVFVVKEGVRTELTNVKLATATTPRYEFVSTGDIDLSAYSGKVTFIFQYAAKGGEANSTTWCLDDFLFGNSLDGGEDPGPGPGPGDLDMTLPAKIKTQYHLEINDHRSQSYSSLWEHFKKTDKRPDGKVNDIYSNKTNYVFGQDQDKGGNNACYNREHSVPKSWYGDQAPMYTDLYHLYPSDKEANGRRSNFPFGEVSGSSSWSNGYCKVGKMNIPGFGSTTVFEPADEVKGNLARTYFYFATRYENKRPTAGEGNKMFAGNTYPYFNEWAIEMLLEWHRLDPVDEAERKRNEAVASIQGNRNPFIDHKDLAEYIWGTKMGRPFNP